MTRPPNRLLAFLLVAVAGARSAAGAAPAAGSSPSGPASQIVAKIEALKQESATLPESDEGWKSLKPDVDRLLSLSASEVEAGRLYTALERLADGHRYLRATAFRIAHPEMSADPKGFEAGWTAADQVLARGEATWRSGSWRRTPAAVRAVAEMEWGQVRHLYEAARDYAAVDSPGSGTHYVGEAEAALEFALFCRSLRFDAPAGAFTARSMAQEIAALDERVVAAYQPPRSIDNHTDFIRINSTIKVAVELDQAGLYHGSLLAWLRAARFFGILEAGWNGTTPRPVETLSTEAAGVATRLKVPGDGSIALLLQQQAEGAIARAANPEGAALQLLAAETVLSQVVPAYATARTAAPVRTTSGRDQVRVTLVRWPYT